MSGRIHFSSGKTLNLTKKEFENFAVKLNAKGIKTQYTAEGHLVPLNSMTMEYIEFVEMDEDIQYNEFQKEVAAAKAAVTTETPKPIEPKTDDEIVADMMAKSNCPHEPDKLELYRQHTAKGIRYFPVCSFCGKRERYVSESKIVKGDYVGTPNAKWTEEDLATAKPWIDK
jgi:hypothetical protein